jgi:hypothetical protein
MWILTTSGFFSIVQKPWDREPGSLTIRSRSREDLERLRQGYLPGMGDISEDPHADYRFRAQAGAHDVTAALAALAGRIDYPNFKDAVEEEQGTSRAEIYLDVWETLSRIQTD